MNNRIGGFFKAIFILLLPIVIISLVCKLWFKAVSYPVPNWEEEYYKMQKRWSDTVIDIRYWKKQYELRDEECMVMGINHQRDWEEWQEARQKEREEWQINQRNIMAEHSKEKDRYVNTIVGLLKCYQRLEKGEELYTFEEDALREAYKIYLEN